MKRTSLVAALLALLTLSTGCKITSTFENGRVYVPGRRTPPTKFGQSVFPERVHCVHVGDRR
jgi:hypothetical protein